MLHFGFIPTHSVIRMAIRTTTDSGQIYISLFVYKLVLLPGGPGETKKADHSSWIGSRFYK